MRMYVELTQHVRTMRAKDDRIDQVFQASEMATCHKRNQGNRPRNQMNNQSPVNQQSLIISTEMFSQSKNVISECVGIIAKTLQAGWSFVCHLSSST